MEFTFQFTPPIPIQNTPRNEERSTDVAGEMPKRTPNSTPCLPCLPCSHPSVKSKCEMSSPWSSILCQRCYERGITCVPKPKAQRKPRASRKPNQQTLVAASSQRQKPIDPTTPATISSPVADPTPTFQNSWTTFHTSDTPTHEQPVQTPYTSQLANNDPYGYGIRHSWAFSDRSAAVHTDTLDANAPPPTHLPASLPVSPWGMSGVDSV